MLAELVTIGDEILIGQIVDTNSVFLSKSLSSIGISVSQITSISDKSSLDDSITSFVHSQPLVVMI